MPSPELGPGEDWQKQFLKVVVSAGPLKGARYPEVSWEDLRRAAKSYKQDPRFCQYAKRMMSEKALGSRPAQPQTASRTWRKMGAEWLMWGLAKAKGKAVLFTFLALLACMLISRPLFHVVMAKSLTMGIRLVLRRSFGLVIIVIDAILDEVAANLEASLLTQPVPQGSPPQHPMHSFEIQQHYSFSSIMFHLIFTCLGALMGRHLPRTQPAVRHPTRLRVVWLEYSSCECFARLTIACGS